MCANLATLVQMRGPYRAGIPLLLLIASLLAGCSAVQPLEEPAWEVHRAGSVGLMGRFAVWDDFEAITHMEGETNFGPVEFDVETVLTGTLGLVGGAEVFIADDVSLQVGVDYRRFEPEPMPPFEFSEIDALEYFLATRWTIPYPLFGVERLRSFVELKLALRPKTNFEANFGIAPNTPPLVFSFDGSSSWSVGLGAGLSYQFRDNLIGHFQLLYEWPLTETTDVVSLDASFFTEPWLLDTETESGGMIALFGITYFL